MTRYKLICEVGNKDFTIALDTFCKNRSIHKVQFQYHNNVFTALITYEDGNVTYGFSKFEIEEIIYCFNLQLNKPSNKQVINLVNKLKNLIGVP